MENQPRKINIKTFDALDDYPEQLVQNSLDKYKYSPKPIFLNRKSKNLERFIENIIEDQKVHKKKCDLNSKNRTSIIDEMQPSVKGFQIKMSNLVDLISEAKIQNSNYLKEQNIIEDDNTSIELKEFQEKAINEKDNAYLLSKEILVNLIKTRKIPDQILNDSNFMNYIKYFSNNYDKIADALIKFYDIFILPSNKTNQRERPNTSKSPLRNPLNNTPYKTKAKNNRLDLSTNKMNFLDTINKEIPNLKKYNENYWKKNTQQISNHPINFAITLINKFCSLVNINKSPNYDLNIINCLYKHLELYNYTKIQKLAIEHLKSKEILFDIRLGLIKILNKIINKENEINIKAKPEVCYKYSVLKGNNSSLVKSLFRQRIWWSSSDKPSEINLLWSQWKNFDFITHLETNEIKIKSFQKREIKTVHSNDLKICNHLEFNYVLGNKKCMYYNFKNYLEMTNKHFLTYMPLTFHIKDNSDPEYLKFKEEFKKCLREISQLLRQKVNRSFSSSSDYENSNGISKNIWIIKPGENTNRGNGIYLSSDLNEIENIVKNNFSKSHTILIQKYIENPLLLSKRKFDLRCFALITSINGFIKGLFIKATFIMKDI